ncbi:MAG: SAM-dependent methyltransferase [Caldimonas sp.]
MSTPSGTLYLVPNTLDFGTGSAATDIAEALPMGSLRVAARLEHWLAENARSTRAFLKRVDRACPLARPVQEVRIVELPRPAKGRHEAGEPGRIDALLAAACSGADIGLLSEAGLPAVADPGALVVEAAHRLGIAVCALPGASAITLAVAASGLNGQSFAFVGYVPVSAEARATRLRSLEVASRRDAQTQVLIETPYRNAALLDALLVCLQPGTTLAVSVGLTLGQGYTRSARVAAWRQRPTVLPADVPAVFAFLATS